MSGKSRRGFTRGEREAWIFCFFSIFFLYNRLRKKEMQDSIVGSDSDSPFSKQTFHPVLAAHRQLPLSRISPSQPCLIYKNFYSLRSLLQLSTAISRHKKDSTCSPKKKARASIDRYRIGAPIYTDESNRCQHQLSESQAMYGLFLSLGGSFRQTTTTTTTTTQWPAGKKQSREKTVEHAARKFNKRGSPAPMVMEFLPAWHTCAVSDSDVCCSVCGRGFNGAKIFR